ncbi:GntR family transcriptional regulator [Streptomyces sp. SID4948]|nr:GntR family transcriptional regulator [Streptomyces sp. SID4948]MYS22070.1 GntR family transcriptional regulator [Streptomyces sp. SID4948]
MKIATELMQEMRDNPDMVELPSIAEIMERHDVSRGVALRAFAFLEKESLARRVPGARWQTIQSGDQPERPPLTIEIAQVIIDDGLTVGAEFPSSSSLCERFGVSRPTIRRALDKLEAQGLLSEGGQGKLRTVLALPSREGRFQP